MSPAFHPGFSGPWRPPPALSSTLATFGCFTFARLFRHSFTASATVLSGRFLPSSVFFLTLLHRNFWHVFVTQMRAGTPHPGSFFVPALTELFLPADAWTWTTQIVVTRPLTYQLLRSIELKLNYWIFFARSKSYVKTIKIHFERDLDMYCLKLLQLTSKLFLSIIENNRCLTTDERCF